MNVLYNGRKVAALMNITKYSPMEVATYLCSEYMYWYMQGKKHKTEEEFLEEISKKTNTKLSKTKLKKLNKVAWKMEKTDYSLEEMLDILSSAIKEMDNKEFKKHFSDIYIDTLDTYKMFKGKGFNED